MFLMSPSLCEIEVKEWWRKVIRNIEEGLRKKFHEEKRFEGWKDEKSGKNRRATGREQYHDRSSLGRF